MRAAEIAAPGAKLRLVERPVPEPGPGEVRVRIEACGVCGSDLFLQEGGFFLQADGSYGRDCFPIVPGHEAAGIVDAVGDAVALPVGAQVALWYVDPSPGSKWSLAGRAHIDPDIRRMGVDVDGAFAEYVVRPAHTLIVPPRPV